MPRDYVQAQVWINLAVSNLPPGEVRDAAVKSRDDVVAKRMTPAQITEAKMLAWEWRPKKSWEWPPKKSWEWKPKK